MSESHVNARLEAFCDGVFAIALTLLIIDIRIPASAPTDTTRDLWLALRHFIPFPTALLGEYLLTDHSAPAVILYSAVCAFQAVGWNVLTRTALMPHALTRNHQAMLAIRANHRYSYYAFALYSSCAIVAFWFPRTVAVAISLIWIVWLIVGVNMKGE
jgi:uncharacterized membrane protein